jgi:hypothetical protein
VKVHEAFEALSSQLKKLALEGNLDDSEGGDLAHITDEFNDLRERWLDRNLDHYLDEVLGCGDSNPLNPPDGS